MTRLLIIISLFLFSITAFSSIQKPVTTLTGINLSQLTPAEKEDFKRFPHMMAFIKTVQITPNEVTSAGNESLVHSKRVFHPTQELWNQFFKNAVADKLTNLRAFALIAREIKNRGITVYGPGKDFENAVMNNNIDLGLSMPATHVGLGIWEPDSRIKDPEFLLHLSVIYTERYIHRFPDEVLPANLKIGYGDQIEYVLDGHKQRGYLLSADLYDGPHGIGFKHVRGVGGQKRGLVGFFQKILFFLPDAVHSMVIDEKENKMVTEAFMNTTVNEFETKDVYRIHYKN